MENETPIDQNTPIKPNITNHSIFINNCTHQYFTNTGME
jgi:hypothetical protein